jgi:hypothetical protein
VCHRDGRDRHPGSQNSMETLSKPVGWLAVHPWSQFYRENTVDRRRSGIRWPPFKQTVP